MQHPKDPKSIQATIHNQLLDTIRQAGLIVLNLDDSDCVYDDLYDPELSTLLGGRMVNMNIWTPEVMIDKKMWRYFEKDDIPPIDPYTVIVSCMKNRLQYGQKKDLMRKVMMKN